MSIMIIVDAKIKDEKLSTFEAFFGELLPDTRNFEGCPAPGWRETDPDCG